MTEQRLARIETLLENLTEKTDARNEHDDKRYDRVARTLYGNNGTPGVLIELDRLKQAQLRSQWLMRVTLGAFITVVVGYLITN